MEQASRARLGQVWDNLHRLLRVQVFGAGRAVGREVTLELLRNGHPTIGLSLYGRQPRSFQWQEERLEVQPIPTHLLPGADIAFVCTTPDLASQLVPALVARGTRVVDLSGAFRSDTKVPMVTGDVNASEIGAFTEFAGLPGRSASLLAPLLATLETHAGLAEVDVFAHVAAASEGAHGILALRAEIEGEVKGEGRAAPTERRHGNLRPVPGGPGDPLGFERLFVSDLRRLLCRPHLPIDLTAVQGDLERTDAFAVKARLRREVTPDEIASHLAGTPEVAVEPGPQGPYPAACAGSPLIHVGRIRAGAGGTGSVCFFAVGDQLRAGAARAALKVASRMPPGG